MSFLKDNKNLNKKALEYAKNIIKYDESDSSERKTLKIDNDDDDDESPIIITKKNY